MTIKRKFFSDDFSKSYNLYMINTSDTNPDNPNPDNPNPDDPGSEDDDKFIYLTVPAEYRCVYSKLLLLLSELGIDMINDCQAVCGGKNKFIITCWNMFQAACAAYGLGETKKAEFLINYIKAQLHLSCEKEKIYYTVTLNVNTDTAGSVIGAGVYEEGTVITIKAIPNTGYEFNGWDDGIVDEVREIIVTENIELTADFIESYYQITVSSTGNGSVSGGGQYKYGQIITISATPDANYKFNNWNDGNTDNPRTVVVTEDKEYIANFNNDVTNIILFGETNDINNAEVNDFINSDIDILLTNINTDKNIIIRGNKENVVEFNQTTKIHYLLVPDDKIELISIGYTTNNIYVDLLNEYYKGTDKTFIYEDVKYRLYLYYAISGSIDVPIVLRAKNK